MAIDYMIDFPCLVKTTLTIDGMVSLIKQRNRAAAIVEMMRRDGRSDEQVLNAKFKVQIMTPGGVQMQDQKVSDLLASTRRLDELKVHCSNCAAGGGRAFGCYKSIGYPISRKAEGWLVQIANVAAEGKGVGMLPLQFIVEKQLDGGKITTMRGDKNGTFFELKQPVDIPVMIGTGLFSRKTVNTDKVFNMVIGLERMRGTHMKMLLLFSGGLRITEEEPQAGTFGQAFKATNGEGKVSWWIYRLKDEPGDDASTCQLKEYFRSLFTAYALDRDMLISL